MNDTIHKKHLIDWFFRPEDEHRSLDLLDKNLTEILDQTLNLKELALILFHSAKNINNGLYGEDDKYKDKARNVIGSHIKQWTNKATANLNSIKLSDHELPHSISHILDGFRLLQRQPPEKLYECLLKKSEKIMDRYDATNLVHELKSIGFLALPVDDNFLKSTIKRIGEISTNSYSATEALDLLHSLAVIDSANNIHNGGRRVHLKKTFNRLLTDSNIREKLAEKCNTDASKHKLLDSIFWFTGKDQFEYPDQKNQKSFSEQDIKELFKDHGADILESNPHPITKSTIDLTAKFGDTKFHVEADGPTHFLRTSDHNIVLNGYTIFQTELKLKRDPEQLIFRLPLDTFYQNMENDEMWINFLLNLEKTDNGGYIITENDAISLLDKYSTKDSEPN